MMQLIVGIGIATIAVAAFVRRRQGRAVTGPNTVVAAPASTSPALPAALIPPAPAPTPVVVTAPVAPAPVAPAPIREDEPDPIPNPVPVPSAPPPPVQPSPKYAVGDRVTIHQVDHHNRARIGPSLGYGHITEVGPYTHWPWRSVDTWHYSWQLGARGGYGDEESEWPEPLLT